MEILIISVPAFTVVAYLEMVTMHRRGKMWKPLMECTLAGLLMGGSFSLWSWHTNEATGTAAMLVPLVSIAITIFWTGTGFVVGLIYKLRGRAMVSKVYRDQLIEEGLWSKAWDWDK